MYMQVVIMTTIDKVSLLELIVHSASHAMCLESQVHILAVCMVDVVLIQDIVQTLIEVLQVEEDNCTSSLHANLDLVDIPTDLYKISTQ